MMIVWKKAQEKLQDVLTHSVFDLWIEPLTAINLQDDCLYLACPDKYFGAYVAQNFLEKIITVVQEVDQQIQRVSIQDPGCSKTSTADPETTREPKQLRLPTIPAEGSRVRALHPRYTFADFMVGESNILAQSACRSMSNLADAVGPCLYINSSTGLGKSHLTHAIAHQILDNSPMTRLHYLTAQQFAAEMVRGIRNNAMAEFKRKYHEHCDILLVEDMQSLTGKKKTQQELNEVLDTLIKSGKRVVMTANSTPRELEGIDEDFRSRMTVGLVTAIKEPDFATRVRIFKKKAKQQGVALADELVTYLAHHVSGDIRRIESAIVAIKARAALQQGKISSAMVEEVVQAIVGQLAQALSVQAIAEMVGRQFQVSVEQMQSRSRKKSIAFPRQVAMFLSRKYTEETLADIGKVFNRDHSTVMHSIKVVSGLTRRDNSVSAQLDLLSQKVTSL